MSVNRIGGGENYTGVFVEWIEEWSQFFEPCNWRTFHPVKCEIEDDRIMGGVEATIIVLGLGARVRWNYARTEQVEDINRMMGEIERQLHDKPLNTGTKGLSE